MVGGHELADGRGPCRMLPTGDVLGWTDYTINGGAQIWRRATNTFTAKSYATTSLFCSGHAYMADGRLLVVGGIVGLQDDLGPQNGTIFDPVTETWSQSSLMFTGRYYPTATALPDGRILVQGGTQLASPVSPTCRKFTIRSAIPGRNWRPAQKWRSSTTRIPLFYPTGVFWWSSEDDKAISSRVLDLNTQTWTTVDSRVFDGHSAAMYQPGKVSRLERLRLITRASCGSDGIRAGHEPILTGLATDRLDGISAVLPELDDFAGRNGSRHRRQHDDGQGELRRSRL